MAQITVYGSFNFRTLFKGKNSGDSSLILKKNHDMMLLIAAKMDSEKCYGY